MNSIKIVKAGLFSSVQDFGRRGYRHLGVSSGGAADQVSMRLANLLVGNEEDTAVIEMTVLGATVSFSHDSLIAICGADADARAAGVSIPLWRPVFVPAAVEIKIGAFKSGARGYLAVAGGVDSEIVLGSRSCDINAGFAGFAGRSLRNGDSLPVGTAAWPEYLDIKRLQATPRLWSTAWSVDAQYELALFHDCLLHVLPVSETTALAALCSESWQVDAQSNRMGLRLQGGPLEAPAQANRISEGVVPGMLQLPPQGLPIILMGDCQTVGGYEPIACVQASDFARLAQCRPGRSVHFAATTPEQAWIELEKTERQMQRWANAINDHRSF